MFKIHKGHRLRIRTVLNLSVILLSLFSYFTIASMSIAAEIPKEEARLRAAIVVGVLRYTTWKDAGIEGDSALLICSVGKTYSANVLKTEKNRVSVHGHKLKVTMRHENEDLGDCPVVIYGKISNTQLNNSAPINYANQLTICDGCNSERSPAIVKLSRQGSRIGIEINLTKAKKSGLKFSSDMLELATIVEGNSND